MNGPRLGLRVNAPSNKRNTPNDYDPSHWERSVRNIVLTHRKCQGRGRKCFAPIINELCHSSDIPIIRHNWQLIFGFFIPWLWQHGARRVAWTQFWLWSHWRLMLNWDKELLKIIIVIINFFSESLRNIKVTIVWIASGRC